MNIPLVLLLLQSPESDLSNPEKYTSLILDHTSTMLKSGRTYDRILLDTMITSKMHAESGGVLSSVATMDQKIARQMSDHLPVYVNLQCGMEVKPSFFNSVGGIFLMVSGSILLAIGMVKWSRNYNIPNSNQNYVNLDETMNLKDSPRIGDDHDHDQPFPLTNL